jgi:flagellar biosynthetic protein FlhB
VSEEHGEKRFDATPSRRERAKRDGNAPRSQDVSSLIAFAAALAGLAFGMPVLAGAALTAVRSASAQPERIDAVHPTLLIAAACVPAVCAAIGATSASLAQIGGLHVGPVSLALGKLAPWPGLKRMFGLEAVVGAVRATLAFAAVTAAVTPIALHAVSAASTTTSVAATAGVVHGAMLQACFVAVATGGLFAFADYAFARRRWLQSLKMTFDELKRDAKEQDGDPQAKSRRKQLHRTFARGGVARTREASFLIVNPTHIAIAIRYAPPAIDVPQILVRAAGAPALEARAIAERANIPVLQEVALARLLWHAGEAGRPIPPESFVAVATIIAALIRAGVLAT